MGAWSEDFGYLNRKIFSNTQNMSEKISKKELVKINNEIAIVIRCVGKEMYWDPNIENPFSLVITIEENENLGLNKYNLYDEICAINNVEGIMTINTELDIEIED